MPGCRVSVACVALGLVTVPGADSDSAAPSSELGLAKEGVEVVAPTPGQRSQPLLWGNPLTCALFESCVEKPISKHQDLASSASLSPSTEFGPCLKLPTFSGKCFLSAI